MEEKIYECYSCNKNNPCILVVDQDSNPPERCPFREEMDKYCEWEESDDN